MPDQWDHRTVQEWTRRAEELAREAFKDKGAGLDQFRLDDQSRENESGGAVRHTIWFAAPCPKSLTPLALKAMRERFGLSAERLAREVRWKRPRIVEAEAGRRRVPQHVADYLWELTDRAAELADAAVAARKDEPHGTPAELPVFRSDEDLWATFPDLQGFSKVG
jgi:hypothetical protein